MDLTNVATEMLEPVAVHRTLGLGVDRALDGTGHVSMPVAEPLHNVVGALHSSGLIALIDAAGLAAIIAAAPDEASARRLQPLGVDARLQFHRPVRGTARAVCHLTDHATLTLGGLFTGESDTVRITTHAAVDTDDSENAVTGSFHWTVRLSPA